MRIRTIFALLAAAVSLAAFTLARKAPPSDLRDAVAEAPSNDFSTSLPSAKDLAAPVPVPRTPGNAPKSLHFRLSGLTGLLVGPGAFDISGPVLKPFVSDGCSMSPNGLPGKKDRWLDCCVKHDIKYWLGGTSQQKEEADKGLRQCISDKGYHAIGQAYYEAVRMGGVPGEKTSFRWGYGWNRLRRYAPVTDEERAQAETLYGKDLKRLVGAVSRNAIPIISPNEYDPSLNKLSAAEIKIYEHLKASLPANDVVSGAELVNSSGETEQYLVNLEKCGGITYTFNKATRELLKAEGRCLK